MTNDPRESTFMVAAEKQIDRLTTRSDDLEKAVTVAQKEARLHKTYIRVLGVVCAAMILCAAALGVGYFQQHQLATKIQQGSISSCQQGNITRAADTQIWTSFIDLLLKGNTNQKAIQEGDQFNKYVQSIDASRNCHSLYGALGMGEGNG